MTKVTLSCSDSIFDHLDSSQPFTFPPLNSHTCLDNTWDVHGLDYGPDTLTKVTGRLHLK